MRTPPTILDRITFFLQYFRVPIGLALAVLLVWYTDKQPMWYGAVVVAFGEWIQVCAAAHLKKQQELAASGPYLHVRNPMYIGRFFVLLGFLMMTHNWYLVGAYVVAFIYYAQTRVSREESRLTEIFGESYVTYCKNVRRWLPRLTPYEGLSGRKFDWKRVLANHEHLNVIGVTVLCAVIYMRIENPLVAEWFKRLGDFLPFN